MIMNDGALLFANCMKPVLTLLKKHVTRFVDNRRKLIQEPITNESIPPSAYEARLCTNNKIEMDQEEVNLTMELLQVLEDGQNGKKKRKRNASSK
jgi:hypothetical protein